MQIYGQLSSSPFAAHYHSFSNQCSAFLRCWAPVSFCESQFCILDNRLTLETFAEVSTGFIECRRAAGSVTLFAFEFRTKEQLV